MLEAKEELVSYAKLPVLKRKLEENRDYLNLLYMFSLFLSETICH